VKNNENNKKMKTSKTEKIVIIDEWAERYFRQVAGIESELNEVMGTIQASGIELPSDLHEFTPKYVEAQVDEGMAAFFKSAKFIPSDIRTKTEKRFSEEKRRISAEASHLQELISKIPCDVQKDATGWHFDEDAVEKIANKKAAFIIQGAALEYLGILQDIAEKMNEARKWEDAHGWRNFVGADDTPDGHAYGWGRLMAEDGHFNMNDERFAALMINGAIGAKTQNI
jgi:hypothetical protein